jgi:hypothetical protein
MSTWRAKALELFPALRESVLRASDAESLWRELNSAFRTALASGEAKLGTPFFKYAAWTLSPSPQTRTLPKVSSAAAEAFYEFADELHQWINRHDFMLAQNGLRYYLGEKRYGEFEGRFLQRTPGYVNSKTRQKR